MVINIEKVRGLKRVSGMQNQPLIILIFLFFCFGSMIFRLFWLQIIHGPRYKELSNENRIKLVERSPIRGRLLDRNGEILATSRFKYNLYAQPRLLDKETWIDLKNTIGKLLKISDELLEIRYQKGIDSKLFRIPLIYDLTPEQIVRFQEIAPALKGIQLDIDVLRHYPYGNLASHVMGYTQPLTAEEFKILSKRGYKIRDRIGRTGIEAAFESDLRGEWGGQMLEVNAFGAVQRNLGEKPAVAGKDITLTIDLGIQLAAEKALSTKKAGAIVALDPRTGAIRAMASRPAFDPNFFSKLFTSQKEYDSLFLSENKPLFSRALNAYDPGSTWKPVTALAGMETGQFPPDIRLKTQGCITYGSHCFPEYNRVGFGSIGYEEALAFSSNTFFYQVGVGVGSQALYEVAKKLGFEALSGIEIGYEESKGLVGNAKWAEKGRGWGKSGQTPWIPEDMASASIGQMVVLVTPLQLARAYAVFANGGYLITPHLVDGQVDWLAPDKRSKVDLNVSFLETVRMGLRKVVESGTANSLNLSKFPLISGKTGTAEDSTGGLDHAWFVGFSPYELGELVVVAFAQNTPGGGSVHALPMAKQVFEAWIKTRDMNN